MEIKLVFRRRIPKYGSFWSVDLNNQILAMFRVAARLDRWDKTVPWTRAVQGSMISPFTRLSAPDRTTSIASIVDWLSRLGINTDAFLAQVKSMGWTNKLIVKKE